MVDVRGENLDDAIMIVDKYLDDAYLSSLKEVTVVHGSPACFGPAFSSFYAASPCEELPAGSFGEGDAGVTVVELK